MPATGPQAYIMQKSTSPFWGGFLYIKKAAGESGLSVMNLFIILCGPETRDFSRGVLTSRAPSRTDL